MKIRNRFDRVRVTVPVTAGLKSMAKQSMRDECDINNILRRFGKTGTITHLAKVAGRYGDFEDISFHEAMNVVRRGEEAFAALPFTLREKFHNDPAEYLEFVQDPKNIDEFRRLGLAKEAPKEPPKPPEAAGEGGPGAKPPAPAIGGPVAAQ